MPTRDTTVRDYAALGSAFSVAGREPDLLGEIDHLLRPFAARTPHVGSRPRYMCTRAGDGDHVLARDGELLVRAEKREQLIDALLIDVNHRAIAAFDGLSVHAGAVAAGSSVIAFPAVSGSGKSTLTAACVAAGFSYVSDEALCIDPADDHIVSYRKPIALAPAAWELVGQRDLGAQVVGEGVKLLVVADALGTPIADTSAVLRLGHVVSLVRREGRPRLVGAARADALATLLSMSFNHYKHPAVAFAVASRLAADAQAWRLEYSDPCAAAELLRTELGASARR